MRLRLTVQRNELPLSRVLWTIPDSLSPDAYTIMRLLEDINRVLPLEADHWGLRDYVVEVDGFECLHFAPVKTTLKEDDHVTIRPLLTAEVRSRTLTGRLQISQAGVHLVDGVPFGRTNLRPQPRPAISIPPPKRPRDDGDTSGGVEELSAGPEPSTKRRRIQSSERNERAKARESAKRIAYIQSGREERAGENDGSPAPEANQRPERNVRFTDGDGDRDEDGELISQNDGALDSSVEETDSDFSSDSSSDSSLDSNSDSSSEESSSEDSGSDSDEDSSSEDSDSDSDTDSDSSSVSLGKKKSGSKPSPQSNTQLSISRTSDVHSPPQFSPPVAPGFGSKNTRKRNLRRVKSAKLKKLKAEGLLPESATLKDVDSVQDDDTSRSYADYANTMAPFAGKKIILDHTDRLGDSVHTGCDSEANSTSELKERYEELARRKAALLTLLGDDTGAEKPPIPVTVPTEPEASIGNMPEKLGSTDAQNDTPMLDSAVAEISTNDGADDGMNGASKRAAEPSAQSPPANKRPKLDLPAPSRMTKTKNTSRKKAKKNDKKEPSPQPPTPNPDPNFWKSRINLTAWECWYEDDLDQLSTPPFPFKQHWDPKTKLMQSWTKESKKKKKGGRKRGSGTPVVELEGEVKGRSASVVSRGTATIEEDQ